MIKNGEIWSRFGSVQSDSQYSPLLGFCWICFVENLPVKWPSFKREFFVYVYVYFRMVVVHRDIQGKSSNKRQKSCIFCMWNQSVTRESALPHCYQVQAWSYGSSCLRLFCQKHWFDQLNFKPVAVTLVNILICISGLKLALVVKNAWFHNSSMITTLTHSNKGSPLQLHQSGVIWKRGQADLASCIHSLTMLISGDHTASPLNVLFMAFFFPEHHLSRKLLLPRIFVLAFMARAKPWWRLVRLEG